MKLQIRWLSLQALLAAALVAALGLAVGAPTAASAKKNKDRCARADARLAATGKGDRDGDGVSNCRERQLRTSLLDADSDDDGLDDGEELEHGCDPNAPDSDDDGTPDGDDPTPAPPPEQKLEAFLDALACPVTGVPGSLTALGVTVVLDDATEFDDVTCEELAAALAAAEPVLVEVKILEDEAGGLLAREVELEEEHHHYGGGGDDDDDDDDDDEDDDGDEDEDDEGEDD